MAVQSRRLARWLLVVSCCGAPLVSSCARCQSIGGVDELAEGAVPVGERITVRLVDGRRVVGVFESVARDTLFCEYRSFPTDAVESIELCETSYGDTAKVVFSIVGGLALAFGVVWWFYIYGPLSESAT